MPNILTHCATSVQGTRNLYTLLSGKLIYCVQGSCIGCQTFFFLWLVWFGGDWKVLGGIKSPTSQNPPQSPPIPLWRGLIE